MLNRIAAAETTARVPSERRLLGCTAERSLTLHDRLRGNRRRADGVNESSGAPPRADPQRDRFPQRGQLPPHHRQTRSPVTALLRRPVEQPPLMTAGSALEFQHADTWAHFAGWLVTLRARDVCALRCRCRWVLLCHGTTATRSHRSPANPARRRAVELRGFQVPERALAPTNVSGVRDLVISPAQSAFCRAAVAWRGQYLVPTRRHRRSYSLSWRQARSARRA